MKKWSDIKGTPILRTERPTGLRSRYGRCLVHEFYINNLPVYLLTSNELMMIITVTKCVIVLVVFVCVETVETFRVVFPTITSLRKVQRRSVLRRTLGNNSYRLKWSGGGPPGNTVWLVSLTKYYTCSRRSLGLDPGRPPLTPPRCGRGTRDVVTFRGLPSPGPGSTNQGHPFDWNRSFLVLLRVYWVTGCRRFHFWVVTHTGNPDLQ